MIEVAITLVVFSIMALGVGMWLVMGARAFTSARENVAISQKAHLALTRIQRELMEMTAVDAVNSGNNCLIYRVGVLAPYYRVLQRSGNAVVLKTDSAGDCYCNTCSGLRMHVLVDQVNRFDITYEDRSGAVTVIPPADFTELVALHVELDIAREDGDSTVHRFVLDANPRNNQDVSAP